MEEIVKIPTLKVNQPTVVDNITGHPTLSENLSEYPVGLNLVDLYQNNKDKVPLIRVGTTTESGGIISPDGKIVTAYHGIKEAVNTTGKITVNYNGEKREAIIEAVNQDTDLAIIKIKQKNLFETFPSLPLSSRIPDKNESVTALGHPLSAEETYLSPGACLGTKTVGELSLKIDGGTLTEAENNRLVELYNQKIEQGNSGGVQLDSSGHVLGIIDMKGLNKNTGFEYSVVTPSADVMSLLLKAQEFERDPNHNHDLSLARTVPISPAMPPKENSSQEEDNLEAKDKNKQLPNTNNNQETIAHSPARSNQAVPSQPDNFATLNKQLDAGSLSHSSSLELATSFSTAQITTDALLIGGGITSIFSKYKRPGAWLFVAGVAGKALSYGYSWLDHTKTKAIAAKPTESDSDAES